MTLAERFGISPIINAAGTLTRLGGPKMLPEVVSAMSEASEIAVSIEELQSAASRVISNITGAEAGYVTSGAAAALTLAVAACMAGLDIARMDQLPFVEDGPNQIIICRPHRNSYDHAFRAAGARLVEVGMSDRYVGSGVRETEIWEIESAITSDTAAIAYTAGENAFPPLREVTAMAKKHDIPVIVDAAGQLPPHSNLRRFINEGAALVSFSGGKAIRGPQGTGILAGRRDLISSVALQHLDMDVTFDIWDPPRDLIPKEKLRGAPRHGIGRGYKVSKEQIIGLLVALDLFTEERCSKDFEKWMGMLKRLEDGLAGCANITVKRLVPRVTPAFCLLEVQLDEARLGKTALDVLVELQSGSPPIYLGEKKALEGSLLVHPVNLDGGMVDEIVARLRRVLG